MSNLIAEWKSKRVQQAPSQKKFLRKLKRLKGPALNERAERLHREVFAQVDCLDCANCCTSIPPIVNKTDSRRIAKLLGMKPAAFAETYLVEDEDGDQVMKTSPCPFLLEDHRCFIYDHRPKACRQYPHTDQLEFSKNLPLHAQNIRYCPAVFHIVNRLSETF